MKANPHFLSPPRPQRESAFTMIDLLAVVAVIALLLMLQLSARGVARDQTLRGQCAGNLHQLALTTAIIATDNSDKLPANIGASFWAWDLSWNAGNLYLPYMSLQTFYCPASGFNYDDNTLLWSNYAGGTLHVIGYAQTFAGNASVNFTNFNSTLTPPHTLLATSLASKRVLFADATISLPGQNSPTLVSKYQWTDIVGGFPKHHRTSHMDGALPAGGNLAMLDGHVEWRNFSLMLPQTINGSAPEFWW